MKNYEEKYKEAFEKAKFYYGNCPSDSEKSKLEKMFPELAESDDEKIRKELIFWINSEIPQCSIQEHADKLKLFVAYLEKQGEQKHVDDNDNVDNLHDYLYGQQYSQLQSEQKHKKESKFYDSMDELIADALMELVEKSDLIDRDKKNRLVWIEKHRAKPVEWSEEDESMRKRAICACNYVIDKIMDNGHYIEAKDWLKSLPIGFITNPNYNEAMVKLLVGELQQIANGNNAPNQYEKEIEWLKSLKPQPKQEWSKEDEKNINELLQFVENMEDFQGIPNHYNKYKDMIKSLCPKK